MNGKKSRLADSFTYLVNKNQWDPSGKEKEYWSAIKLSVCGFLRKVLEVELSPTSHPHKTIKQKCQPSDGQGEGLRKSLWRTWELDPCPVSWCTSSSLSVDSPRLVCPSCTECSHLFSKRNLWLVYLIILILKLINNIWHFCVYFWEQYYGITLDKFI